jgi:hypothetical protein
MRRGPVWFGPPRLRIVVPDSRSMLWIDPYDLPVEATSFLMLSPDSYALRNSCSNSSRPLSTFLIAASPL